MRTILLAAGLGTRLRPLTNKIPKCLVPIKDRPLLDIWLDTLTSVDFGPFLVNTHYLSEQVYAHIQASPYKNSVKLVDEPKLLGTAGTLVTNLDFFRGDEGLLIHADNYCCADFQAFLLAHRRRPTGCLITMMTFRSATPSLCGIVELDDRGVVVGFHEKVAFPPGNLANGAIYILSREFIELLKTDFQDAFDFSTEILPEITGRIFSYETKEKLIDIGILTVYNKMNCW